MSANRRPDRRASPQHRRETIDTPVVNVAQHLKESPGSTRDYDVRVPPGFGSDELATVEPLTGQVRMTRTNRGLYVELQIETALEMECGRCLVPTPTPVRIAMNEEFFPTVDIASGLPSKVEHEPDSFRVDENHEIDLTEAIRQYALVNLPMRALCRPDCRGLCPTCGRDLNQGPCACAPAEAEAADEAPRGPLAELQTWLDTNREDAEPTAERANASSRARNRPARRRT